MDSNDFTLRFFVSQTPQEVYNAINQVQAWWSEDFTGASSRPGDVFEVRFGEVHYSRHQLEEASPARKIVWLVLDSRLNFLQDKTEWNGTRMVFEISEEGPQTKLEFTHRGLSPEVECFRDCSSGWTQYLLHSLKALIETGKGHPNVLQKEIAAKAEPIHLPQ